jgi:HSP20 family protein
MFTHEPAPVPSLDEQSLDQPQQVPVNMYETDDALVVVAAMPGVMPEDVLISLQDQVLTLRSDLRTIAPKPYLLREWLYGRYERVLNLPDGFDGPVSASYGNGQLAVRVLRSGRRDEPVVFAPSSPLRPDESASAG